MVTAPMKLKDSCSFGEKLDQTIEHIKKQRHYFTNKGPSCQSYDFSSSHVWMWYLDYTESWVKNNWCFWTVALEKIFESPLDCKEIQPVDLKGNPSWIFIERTYTEAETQVLCPPDTKDQHFGKDPDVGTDWRWEKKGIAEGERVGWHHCLNGHELGQALGVGDGQESLTYCRPWGFKESDMSDRLNWTELDASVGLLQWRNS